MNESSEPRHRHRFVWILIILVCAGLGLRLVLHIAAAGSAEVSGWVQNDDGPLAGAHVRVRATENMTLTGENGAYLLRGLPAGQSIEVASWYTGHYIASTHVTPTIAGVSLTLRPYHTVDNPDYDWVSPISGTSAGACGNCHPMIMPQWSGNAHGQAVSNARFYSLYDGTNLSGSAAISPGYLLDFPGTAGNCANCHAPAAAVDGYLDTGMDEVRDVITAGLHCDFCHKVGGAFLNPDTGTVYPNTPGVQSQRILRPPDGDNIFFGPYDDIHDPDTYLPLMTQSQYCAPCHQFSFWGTPIYESYEEWLASPYAAEEIVCQNCHMPPNGDDYFALPEAGGLPHPPESIPSHLQPGASSLELLQETVSMTVAPRQMGDQLQVVVTITNTGAGHHVPTDHPGRHLILTVVAEDVDGRPLTQSAGPQVPEWGGSLAGLPGLAFAKVLRDAATGYFPAVNYWKPTMIIADNRIPALDNDSSTYYFDLPTPGYQVTITAELIFRRLYQAEMDARGWLSPDILMEQVTTSSVVEPSWALYLPLVTE